jgi:hypothetical protein
VALYASRCSIHAIAEILSDQGGMPEHLMYASGSDAADVFEPLAFVVCNGCLAALAAVKGEAVSLRTGSALPITYRKMLQEEGGDGD